jgi:hypothetical protein
MGEEYAIIFAMSRVFILGIFSGKGFRRMVLKIFVISAFLLLFSAPAEAATAYATNNLHLRAGPDSRYPSVGILEYGERVELLGCINGLQWCEVETAKDEPDGRRRIICAPRAMAAAVTRSSRAKRMAACA